MSDLLVETQWYQSIDALLYFRHYWIEIRDRDCAAFCLKTCWCLVFLCGNFEPAAPYKLFCELRPIENLGKAVTYLPSYRSPWPPTSPTSMLSSGGHGHIEWPCHAASYSIGRWPSTAASRVSRSICLCCYLLLYENFVKFAQIWWCDHERWQWRP